MSRTRVRTDPELIREVLTYTDATNAHQAGHKYGIHHKTIYRWVQRRDEAGGQWPTDADIAAWRQDHAENWAERKRKALQTQRYRKRVYLNRGPLQVPSLGTTRRLQALYALGWTEEDIARRLGVSGARVGHLMNGYFPTLYPSTVESVARVYDELCMTVPEDPAPQRRGEVRVHERARRDAARRGYAPPLAFDNIDDPDEQPARVTVRGNQRRKDDCDPVVVERVLAGDKTLRMTRAERVAVVRRARALGWTEGQIQERTGITQGASLQRWGAA